MLPELDFSMPSKKGHEFSTYSVTLCHQSQTVLTETRTGPWVAAEHLWMVVIPAWDQVKQILLAHTLLKLIWLLQMLKMLEQDPHTFVKNWKKL